MGVHALTISALDSPAISGSNGLRLRGGEALNPADL
jgi:hypothetical protein